MPRRAQPGVLYSPARAHTIGARLVREQAAGANIPFGRGLSPRCRSHEDDEDHVRGATTARPEGETGGSDGGAAAKRRRRDEQRRRSSGGATVPGKWAGAVPGKRAGPTVEQEGGKWWRGGSWSLVAGGNALVAGRFVESEDKNTKSCRYRISLAGPSSTKWTDRSFFQYEMNRSAHSTLPSRHRGTPVQIDATSSDVSVPPGGGTLTSEVALHTSVPADSVLTCMCWRMILGHSVQSAGPYNCATARMLLGHCTYNSVCNTVGHTTGPQAHTTGPRANILSSGGSSSNKSTSSG